MFGTKVNGIPHTALGSDFITHTIDPIKAPSATRTIANRIMHTSTMIHNRYRSGAGIIRIRYKAPYFAQCLIPRTCNSSLTVLFLRNYLTHQIYKTHHSSICSLLTGKSTCSELTTVRHYPRLPYTYLH